MLPSFLIPACVSWINPCLAVLTLFVPRLDYCSRYWITTLLKPSGYCLLIKDPRLPYDYSSSCLCYYLFAFVLTLPVFFIFFFSLMDVAFLLSTFFTLPVFLTTSWNKACKWICTSHISFAPLQAVNKEYVRYLKNKKKHDLTARPI